MTSEQYWSEREAANLDGYLPEEEEYNRRITQIYQDMYDRCCADIEAFYGRYAAREGITLAEARRRVSQVDIEEYERKAERYVRDASRDRAANGGRTNYSGYYFSEQANEEMRLYNLTMKVNRLEMLKANLGLEMVRGHAELETFMGGILRGRTMAELERQAGILGKTIHNNAKMADAIVNASFHNATFSDRIWQYQDLMKAELSMLLQQGLIQGKNPRALAKDLEKYYFGDPKVDGGARYCAERLMRTELARVQTEAQRQSYKRNGFDMFTFKVNNKCCSVCADLSNQHFNLDDMTIGLNAPPIHPNCRCSTAPYSDREEYDAWLDYLEQGGSTESWNKLRERAEIIQKFYGKERQNRLAKVGDSGIIKLNSKAVREWYVSAAGRIGDNIDHTLPIEEQAQRAFAQRNFVRTLAREMMADEEARQSLDAKRPNPTFEQLVRSKMQRKGMTREEAIRDIYRTATETNESVNRELGVGGD